MNRIFLALFTVFLSSQVSAADLDQILTSNAKAHGGETLKDVNAVKVNLHIVEPTFEVSGVYYASREGFMRIDIYSGDDRVFAEGLTSKCAWEWNPGQPPEALGECVGETETGALRRGIVLPGHFYSLSDVHVRGEQVELVDESDSEWQVRVTLDDGFSRDYFINKTDYRFTRARDHRAFHPGIDPTKVNIETRYEEPEFINGALRFMKQVNVNIDSGEVLGTTTVTAYEVNPPTTADMFEAGWMEHKPDQ